MRPLRDRSLPPEIAFFGDEAQTAASVEQCPKKQRHHDPLPLAEFDDDALIAANAKTNGLGRSESRRNPGRSAQGRFSLVELCTAQAGMGEYAYIFWYWFI